MNKTGPNRDRHARHTRVARRVVGVYVLCALLIGAVAVLTRMEMHSLLEQTERVEQTHVVLANLDRVDAALSSAVSGVRGYMLTNDPRFLQERDIALSELDSARLDVRTLISDDARQTAQLTELERLIDARIAWLNRTQTMYDSGAQVDVRRALREGAPARLAFEIRNLLNDMQRVEDTHLRALARVQQASGRRLSFAAAILLLLVAGAAVASLWTLIRELRTQSELHASLQERERSLSDLNAELERHAATLKQTNADLEGFSYTVSHDLRSPLRAISGFATMLEEDHASALNDEARRYLTVIRDGAARMSSLIDDLLAFSRVSRQPLAASRCDHGALVAEAGETAKADHPGSDAEIILGELPVTLGDPGLLRQVWLNLLGNAVKYSSRRPGARVEVGATCDAGEACFFVRDNGAGFNMKYRDKLFHVFQRLHGQDEFPGTGIGLAIVSRIVTKHGGRVWAESEVNRGSTFYFSLPHANLLETAA